MPLSRDPTAGSSKTIAGQIPSASRGAEGNWRRMIGVAVSSGCRTIRAAAATVVGRGLDAKVDSFECESLPAPDDVTRLYAELTERAQPHAALGAELAARLAELHAGLIMRWSDGGGSSADGALAVGVCDPGLWRLADSNRFYASLCDAARLADAAGLTVIDAFPARDLSQGGLGGPLGAAPQWMLLRHPTKTRVLIDLGQTTRMTYLPTGDPRNATEIVSLDVGPGASLLDRLAFQLTDGKRTFDPGGHLAVQGRRVGELVDHWLADPYFQRLAPRWHPLGSRHEQELNETVRMAVASGWSIRDLLCTACHFIAEAIGLALERNTPRSPAVDEIIITGGGRQNGMLLRSIAARAAGTKLVTLDQCGIADEALEPLSAALLAMLHLDQTPANHGLLTGADAPRVLGRLTPGTPQNWRRVVRFLAENQPARLPLRSAM